MFNLREQELRKKSPNRSISTPLAFPCNHVALELDIHPKEGKPYTVQTLINYYHSINREIKNGTLVEPVIVEYIASFTKPSQE